MQMSCTIVSDATSGGGKVLSVARLEMAYQRLKMIVFGGLLSYLATLGRRSTNDSSLYSQSSRKKVECKPDTLSKTCKDVITSL